MLGLAGGCYEEPVVITTYPPGETPPSSFGLATAQPSSAAPSADCVDGWYTPIAPTAEYEDAVTAIVDQLGVDGPWQLGALRYFTGPDAPGSEVPADIVERWYVSGALATDANVRGRFLIERRNDADAEVVAVAPYESTSFQSPDWTGFIGDTEPQTYLGLPGQWSGTPYDFVSGAGGTGQPGLPPDVVGCVSDT